MDLATRSALQTREQAAAAARQAQVIQLTEREESALRLYALNATWNAIAAAIGVKTAGGAQKFTMKALAKRASVIDATPISEARALALARLEEIIGRFLPLALSTGEDKPAKIVMDALTRQARILGLEAPRQHEHRHEIDTPEAMETRRAEALARLAAFHSRTIEGETTDAS